MRISDWSSDVCSSDLADRTWVRAVGTAFNVYRQDNGVRVTVSEGKVKVGSVAKREAPSDSALDRVPVSLLGAGQQAVVRGGTASVHALPMPAVARGILWRSGTIYFRSEGRRVGKEGVRTLRS